MPKHAFNYHNGQVKTPLRWYDSIEKRNRNKMECRSEMEACPYELLTSKGSLLPFQFVRPRSTSGITSWKVYGQDGTLVKTYTGSDISLIRIDTLSEFDVLTYNGQQLSSDIEPGYYYSEIVTGGHSYYSEDYTVKCVNEVGSLPEDIFAGGLYSEANPNAIWHVGISRIFTRIQVPAGPPSGPAINGMKVATITDGSLWTYNGTSWLQSIPADAEPWYDNQTGNWYKLMGGTWLGIPDPVNVVSGGVNWPSGEIIPIYLNAGSDLVLCQESTVRVDFSTFNGSQGSVHVELEGPGITALTNGDYSFNAYVANGYLLTITPTYDYDGSVIGVQIYCPSGLEKCHMSLEWTSCGAVGNTYNTLISGSPLLTQKFYLPLSCLRPRATPKLIVETEEKNTGEKVEVFRRKENVWQLNIGMVPWYVADALTDMCLYDTVKLRYPTMDEAGIITPQRVDVLINPKVEISDDNNLSYCLKEAVMTFELDNASVACCDKFLPHCSEPCAVGRSMLSAAPTNPPDGDIYISDTTPEYVAIVEGEQLFFNCDNGVAGIEQSPGVLGRTMVWDINTQTWVNHAELTLVFVVGVVEGLCQLNIRGNLLPGFTAVLQYIGPGGTWVDDPQLDFGPELWQYNTVVRETPADQTQNRLRMKVYVGDCVAGYSDFVEYTCPPE